MSDSAGTSLHGLFAQQASQLKQARDKLDDQLQLAEVGHVISISAGIARVSGLPGVGYEEVVAFTNNIYGIAFNIDEQDIGVLLLGPFDQLHAGDEVRRTGRVMDVAVGDSLLGRIIDPLGRPLDGLATPKTSQRLPVERPAPAIMQRSPVTQPLQTGIKVVDALIPIGRGQRELIMGDRQTGKTTVAIDTILNQRDKDIICIYCAIGQRSSSVAKTLAILRQHKAMDYTLVMMSEGSAPPGLNYIAPYAATTIAEYFMHKGKDVLIVYDDLTQHARAYRELSLLMRRPPGREAFPGDVFYIHSRLLERATHLKAEFGGGSLTALPILETEAQNMSAYIPTNLISITDGQIYLSPTLFELGVLPAINVGQSVSRVGGKAQRAIFRSIAGDLKLAYAQFEELENFARFGAHLDQSTKHILRRGERIRACLKQPDSQPINDVEQIAILLTLTAGYFDGIELTDMPAAELTVRNLCQKLPAQLRQQLESGDALSETTRQNILALVSETLQGFTSPQQPAPIASEEIADE